MLLRPRWLAGHVLVLAVVIGFVALGLWQLGREQDKDDARAEAARAFAAPAPALTSLGEPEPGARVELRGTYEVDSQHLLRNRLRGDAGGYDVLTVLRDTSGRAVVVDRGWVPRADADRDGAPAPPAGTVVVRGTIGSSRPLQPDDTVDERGGTPAVPRVDLSVIGDSVDGGVEPVWVLAQWQEPAPTGSDPQLPEPVVSDDVNHLSYAFQWFAFATIVAIGWPIVLYRAMHRTRGRARDRDGDRAPAPVG